MLATLATYLAPALAGVSAACFVKAALDGLAGHADLPRLPAPAASPVDTDRLPVDPRDMRERAVKLFCAGRPALTLS